MTEAGKIIYLTDRSAAETDDQCGMMFWLNRKEGGRGIVPRGEILNLQIGKETHNDLEAVATMDDLRPEAIQECIDEVIGGLTDDDKLIQGNMELLYRRMGWFAAFALYIEPRIRERYNTVSIESEIVLDRDPLWVAVTPDRILEDKVNGHLEYREYKTTISASSKWLQSWLYAIQLHIGIAAAQEELGKKVKFAQIMGLMKGSSSSLSDHHLVHPYVWGYYNVNRNEWTHSYDKARSAAWVAMPVWEFPDGIVKWVQTCGEEVALNQFPHSPPVFLHEPMLNEWVDRRLHREREIACVEDLCKDDLTVRSRYFQRRTRSCRPAFGDQCAYMKACWNATTASNPLADPDYIVRTPHHLVELPIE